MVTWAVVFTLICIIAIYSWQGKLGGALGGGDGDTDGGIAFSIGNVLSLKLFESEKPEKREIERLADTLDTVNKRLEHIEA